MGTNAAAEKAYPAGEQVPVVNTGTYNRYIDLANVLEISLEDRPYEEQFNALAERLQNLQQNFKLWWSSDNNVLYQHLAFTTFVPGGKADRARKAVEILKDEDFSHITLRAPTIARLIRPYVRFHNVKAKRLKESMQQGMKGLRHRIQWNQPNLQQIHDYILKNFKGLGRKATAHFMRNTGLRSSTFAYPIIDVHIHKVLDKMGTKHATYDEAEQSFWQLAKLVNIDVILLDAALWCTYARNWNFANSDFDNYGYEHGK